MNKNTYYWIGFDNLDNTFIGREKEFSQVNEFFNNKASVLLTLNGPPEIGKTAFAYMYAKHHERNYASVAFVNYPFMDNSESKNTKIKSIINSTNEPSLIIIDDADELSDATIVDLLINSKSRHIIVITRKYRIFNIPEHLADKIYNAYSLSLNNLTYEQQYQRLKMLYKREVEYIGYDQIINIANGNPLFTKYDYKFYK